MSGDEEIKEALEEVLAMYDIKLEMDPESEEQEKAERFGDYAEIINKTQERLDELSEKAEQIYERTGMTREELEAYSSNRNNFSEEQWEALEKVKAACEKYKREAHERIGEEQFEKRVEKPRKKESHRFAKKKHWIPL